LSGDFIVFQDEVHFYQGTTITRTWAIKGSNPQVGSAPGRQSVKYSGYVVSNTGELIVTKPDWFNYETVIDSLREFIRQAPRPRRGKRLVLVLDNAPWHKKAYRLIVKERSPQYADIRKALTLVLLPAYSPDLNPIEQCWRITRREVTHNRYFATLKGLIDKLDEFFAKYRKPNEKFMKLCTFHWLTEPKVPLCP